MSGNAQQKTASVRLDRGGFLFFHSQRGEDARAAPFHPAQQQRTDHRRDGGVYILLYQRGEPSYDEANAGALKYLPHRKYSPPSAMA